uniref:ATP-binding protein n=1 Tax=Luteolibacter marinus TaxID=2776705 RepID=UPI001866D66B
ARRPPGWRPSPAAVLTFIRGSDGKKIGGVEIGRKYYGDDLLVERSIVTLLGNRGLMLVGEPGTAKSMLSELLAAAISGDSSLTIQGTAGTTEDQIKYSWNYALLLAEGPTPRSLVPGPVHRGLKEGKIVRFEEITRCQPEMQDALVSVLSDKHLHVPELGDDGILHAAKGFNIVATANLRDRGVNEMSSALKRRFNFETVPPIADRDLEMTLVREQTSRLLAAHEVEARLPDDTLELLVTTFQDLRNGRTQEGATIEKPGTVMSTAEAVAVAFSACLDAHYFGPGQAGGQHVVRQIVGTVFKDDPEDSRKLAHYLEVVAKVRSKRGGVWKSFYDSRKLLG